jgi:kynurenine formamidase
MQALGWTTHVGTHADAPSHFVEGGQTVDEIPTARLCGEATVIHVERPAGEAITRDDLESLAGPRLQPGDLLLVRTGFGRLYHRPAEYLDFPFLALDAAEWIVDRGIAALGMDTLSPEMPTARRPAGHGFPIHRMLLEAGVPIVENLYLEPVADLSRLAVQLLPLRLTGGDGAQVRAVATPA